MVSTLAVWLLGPVSSYGTVILVPPFTSPGSPSPTPPAGSSGGLSLGWNTTFGADIGTGAGGQVYAEFPSGFTGSVSEGVTTTQGTTYDLTFSVLGGSTSAALEALWNNSPVYSVDFSHGAYTTWTTFDVSFVSTTAGGTVSFQGHDDGPPYVGGVGLTPVPETANATVGAGALLLVLLAHGSLRARRSGANPS